MGYASNKKFSPLTDNINLIIDGCGNTHKDKYYFNGTYIDLCGLSIEEYMKNPCCGGSGSGSGGNTENTKPTNEILVKSFEDENGVVYYQAFAKYPVASNMKIIVNSTSGVVTELDIFVGDKESKPEIGETLTFEEVSLNIDEDDSYKYETTSEETQTSYDIYTNTDLVSNKELSLDNFILNTMDMNTTIDLVFIIPSTDINYNEMTDEKEFEDFCINNQYSLNLLLPKKVYDNKLYTITNYGGSDVTNKFVYETSANINDAEYVFLNEKATEDIMPYVPLYGEELKYEYKLTLNK